jgi:hypothetical protein
VNVREHLTKIAHVEPFAPQPGHFTRNDKVSNLATPRQNRSRAQSSIACQLPLSQMRIFAIGIERDTYEARFAIF